MYRRRVSSLAWGAAALVLASGTTALVGWVFDVPLLQSGLQHGPRTVPAASVSFLVAAIGLLTLTATVQQPATDHQTTGAASVPGSRSPDLHPLVRLCGTLVALVGVVRLALAATNAGPHLDYLWLSGDADPPGRMAPATALSLLLLGLALVLATTERWPAAGQPLTLVAALTGAVGVVHYLYGGGPLTPYAHMALPSALNVVLLASGLLCARPDVGLVALLTGDGAGGWLARRLLPATLVIPLFVGWLRVRGQSAGWFGTGAGTGLFALTNITLFTLLIWVTATLLQRLDTERLRAEEGMRESRDLLEAISANSPAVIYAKDLEGRYLLINPRFRELFHVGEEMLGKTDYDLFEPQAAETFRAMDRRVADGGVPLTEEEIVPLDDGVHTYISVKTPLRDEHDAVYAVVGISTDITARKRAEEALRVSEERTRQIIDTALDAVIAIDAEGTIIEWSPQADTTFGWSREQVLGRSLADVVIPEESREAHRRGMAVYLRTGESTVLGRRLEATALRADGREFPVELSITASGTGDDVTFSAFVRDITERKTVERALRESEERFRLMADSAPVLIWVSGVDKLCTWFNRQWLEFVGRPMEQELGNGWAENVHPDDFDRCLEIYTTSFDARRPFSMEYRLRRHDGEWRWVLDNGIPRATPTGEFAGYIGSCVDVTEARHKAHELRESEERYRSLAQALEERVQARTAELESANRELEAFSHSVSHDLRAPVRAIGGFSQILLQDGASRMAESDQDLLRRISAGADQMSALIEGLMNLSQLGRHTLNREQVDVRALVDEVIAEQSAALDGEPDRAPVDVRIGDLPDCDADPVLLKQVLVNLLSNAFKYTRQADNPLVEVGSETIGGRRVYFVRDNGAGFDMHHADGLFGVFRRLHRAEEFEGTGVGLSIVERIIRRHGGEVWAEAAVGQGATLYFTLSTHPRAPAGSDAHAAQGTRLDAS